MSITTLVVGLRLYFKCRNINCIGWDDHLIVLSLVSNTSSPPNEVLKRWLDLRLCRSGLSHNTDLVGLRTTYCLHFSRVPI